MREKGGFRWEIEWEGGERGDEVIKQKYKINKH